MWRAAALLALSAMCAAPLSARMTVAEKKQVARSQFETAEKMREALNGRPESERRRSEYERAIEAYRRVYYLAPNSIKADAAVVAVAELLADEGRTLNDKHLLNSAIGQYQFLLKEYPGSSYRVDAQFTIAQIYKEDLQDKDQARTAFQDFLKHYPHSPQADDARLALSDMDGANDEAETIQKMVDRHMAKSNAAPLAPPTTESDSAVSAEQKPLVTGVRTWSTPNYTRIAIDLQSEVEFSSERIDSPDRIYFDLKNTRLASVLVGKTFEVGDGFLKKIRVAQYQPGDTRVVLDIDKISDYSAFLLPNPYRLIIDIHGKQTAKPSQAAGSSKPQDAKNTAPAKAPEVVIARTVAPKNADEKQAAAATEDSDLAAWREEVKRSVERTEAKAAVAKSEPTTSAANAVAVAKPGMAVPVEVQPAARTIEEIRVEAAKNEVAKNTPPVKKQVVAEATVTLRPITKAAELPPVQLPRDVAERLASSPVPMPDRPAARPTHIDDFPAVEIVKAAPVKPAPVARPVVDDAKTQAADRKIMEREIERKLGFAPTKSEISSAPTPKPVRAVPASAEMAMRNAPAPTAKFDEAEFRRKLAGQKPQATTSVLATDIPSEHPVKIASATAPAKLVVDESDAPAAIAKPSLSPTTTGTTTSTRLSKTHRRVDVASIHVAQPTSDGDRSLIRALGLKIGKIVIDAGHGGHDTGTIGPDGLREKDLVLDVAQRLGKLVEQRLGSEVIYTRDDDTFIPLETRTAIANQHQADLFISIHANSSNDPGARGVETYYLNFTSSRSALEVAARENAVSDKSIHELQDLVKKIALKEKVEESREFALDVQHSLYSGLTAKATSTTMRDRGVKKAPFIVLIGANMPSILAEISFISNPTDEHRLQTPEYRQKIAESLFKGISKYVNGLSGMKIAANTGLDKQQ